MVKSIESRLSELENEHAALRDVVLSAVIAIDHRAEGFARAVIDQAQAIADVSAQGRPLGEVRAIVRLLDEIRIALDAPAND